MKVIEVCFKKVIHFHDILLYLIFDTKKLLQENFMNKKTF